MKRVVAISLAVVFAVSQLSSSHAQVEAIGIIAGTVSGPSGALAGLTVEVVNAGGAVVGSATTAVTGAFSISGLTAGTFTVQVVGMNGAVIGTSSATLAAGAMTATVSVSATAGAVAAAAAGAVAGAGAGTGAGALGAAAGLGAAGAGGLSTGVVLAGIGAAAAAAGTAAIVGTDPVSGSN